MTIKLVAITGDTYPVKDALRALGARWNPDQKCWMISAAKADQAQAIVSGPKPGTASAAYRPYRCLGCGAVAARNSRGYPTVKILRSGECVDCYEERKMGY